MSKKPKTPEEEQAALAKQEEKDRRFYMRAHRLVAGFFRFILRLHPRDTENMPTEGACLVCANHVAAVDVISVAAVIRRRPRFLAKVELFRVPILGWLIRRLGAFRVDRRGSDVAAIKKTLSILESGEAVVIFPQGHRYGGKNPADTPIKDGAGMIALRANCPVVPVCIKTKKQRYAPFRRVEVIFGKPIPPEALCPPQMTGKEAYRIASATIFREICALGGFAPSASDTLPEAGGDRA